MTATPFDLVDLLFNLQGFEIVEFGFVGLEFSVEFVFTCFFLHLTGSFVMMCSFRLTDSLIALETDDSTPFISCGKVVARMVEFDSRYDVSCETDISITSV